MAIAMGDNFKIQGRKPNVERDLFATLDDLLAFDVARGLPDMFIASVAETNKVYIYNINNNNDPSLGKWRELESGDAKLTEKIISSTAVGLISEGSTFEAGTSIEDILRDMLLGEIVPTTSFYYGVNANKITDLSLLTEVEPISAYSATITANNEYIIFAFPIDSNVKIMATGFDYTDSFEKVETSMYRFYYSEYKTTCNNFEYNIIFE